MRGILVQGRTFVITPRPLPGGVSLSGISILTRSYPRLLLCFVLQDCLLSLFFMRLYPRPIFNEVVLLAPFFNEVLSSSHFLTRFYPRIPYDSPTSEIRSEDITEDLFAMCFF